MIPRLAAQAIALGVWMGAVMLAVGVGLALDLPVYGAGALLIVGALGARWAEQRLMDASGAPSPPAPPEAPATLGCSFCGKSQREVRKLIAGPSVYICDECIGLCNEILAEGTAKEPAPATPPPENVWEPPTGTGG